ncbi:hypothetical protein HK096_008631 [Nowakowskiella sp. JEL0078]|nr:hypothetical protein HK096_008631 [Nowakowskiella sp. JEL0078]
METSESPKMTLLSFVFIPAKVLNSTTTELSSRVSATIASSREYAFQTASSVTQRALDLSFATIRTVRSFTPAPILSLTDKTYEIASSTVSSVFISNKGALNYVIDNVVAVENAVIGYASQTVTSTKGKIDERMKHTKDIAVKTTTVIVHRASDIVKPYMDVAVKVTSPYVEMGQEISKPYVQRATPFVLKAQVLATPILKRLPILYLLAKKEQPMEPTITPIIQMSDGKFKNEKKNLKL